MRTPLSRCRTPHARTAEVSVFCNATGRLGYYRPGDHLVFAYTCTLTGGATTSDTEFLERVFAMFNDHPDPNFPGDAAHTSAWYDSGLRSLSVGDIVAINGRHYACDSHGWVPLRTP